MPPAFDSVFPYHHSSSLWTATAHCHNAHHTPCLRQCLLLLSDSCESYIPCCRTALKDIYPLKHRPALRKYKQLGNRIDLLFLINSFLASSGVSSTRSHRELTQAHFSQHTDSWKNTGAFTAQMPYHPNVQQILWVFMGRILPPRSQHSNLQRKETKEKNITNI